MALNLGQLARQIGGDAGLVARTPAPKDGKVKSPRSDKELRDLIFPPSDAQREMDREDAQMRERASEPVSNLLTRQIGTATTGMPDSGESAPFRSTTDRKDELEAGNKSQDALDRAAREKALGLEGRTTAAADVARSTKAMTFEEYNALGDRQRAAVDYNTQIADAVSRDLENQDKYKDVSVGARENYDTRLKEMFGEDGGSDLYAPETLAVLSQLKLDDKLADMDDFLGLKVAITEDDLGMLTDDAGNIGRSAIESPRDDGRYDMINRVVDRSQNLQDALGRGNKLLEDFNTSALMARETELGDFGAKFIGPSTRAPGWGASSTADGESTLDGTFQSAFDLLAAKNSTVSADEVLADIRANFTPEQQEAFFSYAKTRGNNAKTYGKELGQTAQVDYKKPDEFLELFGRGE